MEQLDYNLLFRWVVGLSMDELSWDHSVYSKNRNLNANGENAQKKLTKQTYKHYHSEFFRKNV